MILHYAPKTSTVKSTQKCNTPTTDSVAGVGVADSFMYMAVFFSKTRIDNQNFLTLFLRIMFIAKFHLD